MIIVNKVTKSELQMSQLETHEMLTPGSEPGGKEAIAPFNEHLRENEGVFLLDDYRQEKIATNLYHGHINIGGGVDWTLEVPENPDYKGIVLFGPGYLGIKQSSRAPRAAGAQIGEATLSYSPAREDGAAMFKAFQDPQFLHAKTLGEIFNDLQKEKPKIIRYIPGADQLDFDRITLKLHSMSGLSGPRFALEYSQAVEKIIGYATAGFGHPTLGELAMDFPRNVVGAVKHEIIPGFTTDTLEFSFRNLRDVVNYYRRTRVLFEGLSCLQDKTIKEVGILRDRGIPYHYLGFGRDILVRPSPDIAQYVSSFNVMEKYGHLAPQVKADKVAQFSARIAISN